MKFLTRLVLWTLALSPGVGLATTRPKVESAPPGEVDSRENVEYQRAMARIEAKVRRGGELSAITFRSFNWVGRTAAINYACSAMSIDQCRTLLEAGVIDRAMVVRDHSLRLILASDKYLPEEKKFIAQKVIDDSRNYRGGIALWIVGRARRFMQGGGG